MSTTIDIPRLQRALLCVADGAARSDQPTDLSCSIKAACDKCNEATLLSTRFGSIDRLHQYVDAINISSAMCSTAVLMASWEACKIDGNYQCLVDLCEAHAANSIAPWEAHLIAALGVPSSFFDPNTTIWSRLTRSLEARPDYAQAWYAAYRSPEICVPVAFKGRVFSEKIEFLLEAVTCPDALSAHWYTLGIVAADRDGIIQLPNHKRVTRRDCFEHALRLDPTWGDAYFELARCMSPSDTLVSSFTDGIDADVTWCLARAIEFGCKNTPEAWYGLMNTISTARRPVSMHAETISLPYVCLKVIELCNRPERPARWALQAWEQMLHFLTAHSGDGYYGDPNVRLLLLEHRITRRLCARQIARYRPNSAAAWLALGLALETEESAVTMEDEIDASSAYARALSCPDCDAAMEGRAWAGLAKTLLPGRVVMVGERKVQLVDAVFRLTTLCPHRAQCWALFAPLYSAETSPEYSVALPDGSRMTMSQWHTTMQRCIDTVPNGM